MTQPDAMKRVAVLGAGTIGASWTAWFRSRGMTISVWDPRPEAADYVRRYVADAWPAMARLGMVTDASPDAWRFDISPEAAVADAEFVQENAPERMTVKRALYTRLDSVLPPDAVFASSTSGLIMSELQSGLKAAARFAVGHPFNPPHLIPLVEVVGGRDTAPETVQWCLSFYRSIGKKPIWIRKEAALARTPTAMGLATFAMQMDTVATQPLKFIQSALVTVRLRRRRASHDVA